MTKLAWTSSQEAAITATDTDVLVAAGAGTGKTAVLVERVSRLITRAVDAVDVDRLLVVTFTEAAAGQMRERIGRALTGALLAQPEAEHLRQQLSLLPKARIATIHAFCLAVVRHGFPRLGLDPALRIIDPHETELLKADVVDDLLEEALTAPDQRPGFAALLDCYGGQGGDRLAQLILNMHRQFTTQPRPEVWLKEIVAPFAAAAPQGPLFDALLEAAGFRLQQAAWALEQAAVICRRPGAPLAYLDNLRTEGEWMGQLATMAKDGTSLPELLAAVAAHDFAHLPRAGRDTDEKLKKRVTSLRGRAKDLRRDLLDQLAQRPLPDQLADLTALAPPMAALAQLIRDFDRDYRTAKSASGRIDFNDLERYCLDLLQQSPDARPLDAPPPDSPMLASPVSELAATSPVPSDLARALQQQFRAVIVDEYQDINPTQEAILSLVARLGGPEGPPNRFAVGDVKQSIYRFRLAEPGIFLSKYNTFSREPGQPTRRIDLQDNFRSRANILAAVNFTFRQLFTAPLGELGYDQSAWLAYGGGYPAVPPDPAVELHILEREQALLAQSGTEAETAAALALQADEREALVAARRIQQLVAEGSVWDAKTKTMRPPTYDDIAILMRSPRHRANTFVEVLGRCGIPATADLTTGYFDSVEVATVLALLKIVDNPQQDIPLAAVLHSPLVGLDIDDLARVRLAARQAGYYDAVTTRAQEDDDLGRRLTRFLQQLDKWRTQGRRGRLADLVWAILAETGYLAYVGSLPAGEQRRANLLALHQRAREFDGFARRGLFRFLRFIEGLQAQEQDTGTAAVAGGNAAVRLMSIHRSKGLEFPVVLLCDLGRQVNRADLREPLLIHRGLGLGPDIVDPELGIRYPSLARHAIHHQLEKELIAEEMRVLYVAMTRAQEQLIMIGSVRDLPASCTFWSQGATRQEAALPDPYLLAADRPLDWLATAVARHQEAGLPIRNMGDPGLQPQNEELAQTEMNWQVHLLAAGEVVRMAAAVAPAAAGVGRGIDAAGAAAGQSTAAPDGAATAGPSTSAPDGAATAGPAAAPDPAPKLPGHPDWISPYLPLANRYAKVRATEVKAPGTKVEVDEEAGLGSGVVAAAIASTTGDTGGAGDTFAACDAGAAGETAAFDAGVAMGDTGMASTAGGAPFSIPLARPRFLQKAEAPTPLELGSAVHLILQHVSLVPHPDEQALQQTAAFLVDRGLLAAAAAKAVNLTVLARFFASPLGRRLTGAAAKDPAAVQRELAFSCRLPVRRVYPDLPVDISAGEWVLVQGIIDCIFTDAQGLVLLDFKTDRINPDDAPRAAARYQQQLATYVTAAESLMGRPVAEAHAYFLVAGRGVQVHGEAR